MTVNFLLETMQVKNRKKMVEQHLEKNQTYQSWILYIPSKNNFCKRKQHNDMWANTKYFLFLILKGPGYYFSESKMYFFLKSINNIVLFYFTFILSFKYFCYVSFIMYHCIRAVCMHSIYWIIKYISSTECYR